MEVRVRELRLPGIGHRYDMTVDGGRTFSIIVEAGGQRQITVSNPGADVPAFAATLSQDQAAAVAAILTGARFSIDTSDDDTVAADEVSVETVTLGPRSPALGNRVPDIPLLEGCDAAVLAVIRDDTPELVEGESSEPVRVGDRIVVAARRDRLPAVVQALAG